MMSIEETQNVHKTVKLIPGMCTTTYRVMGAQFVQSFASKCVDFSPSQFRIWMSELFALLKASYDGVRVCVFVCVWVPYRRVLACKTVYVGNYYYIFVN